METKTWWTSKTIWGAVVTFLGGGLVAIGATEIGTALIGLGASIGFIGLRMAVD